MNSSSIDVRLVSLTAPGSREAEQYQSLRVKLEALQRDRDLRVIAITSPAARDGKTVTALNLAGALARGSATRVLFIEADIRRPSVARYLRLDDTTHPSFTDILLDPQRPLQDAVQHPESVPFDLIVAGSTDVPVHEMFRSPRLEALLKEARQQYDYVVLDTPPLGPVSDCALLARWVDGLLLVVAAHRTPRKLLESTLSLLDPATVIGIVFNRDDRPLFGYGNSYRGYFPRARRAA